MSWDSFTTELRIREIERTLEEFRETTIPQDIETVGITNLGASGRGLGTNTGIIGPISYPFIFNPIESRRFDAEPAPGTTTPNVSDTLFVNSTSITLTPKASEDPIEIRVLDNTFKNGQIILITVKDGAIGRLLVPNGTEGNINITTNVDFVSSTVLFLQWRNDSTLPTSSSGSWVVISDSSGGGGGAIIPNGTVENQHLEWDNTLSVWEAVTSIAFNNNDSTLATLGDGRFANGGTLAWRDGLAAQNMFMSFNSNQEWRFDSLTAGGSGFNIRENFIDMIEQQTVPTGTANTIKMYAKEDTDTITKLFYKDSTDVERSVGIDGANKTLSNLTVPTSINTSLIPDTDGLEDLGSPTFHWDFTYSRAIQFFNNKTVTALGIGNNGIGADVNGVWFNLGATLDDFKLYERGVEIFKFQKFLTNVYEFHMGDSTGFASGEEYRIQMGSNSISSGRIFFIEGTGNDLILDRAGGGINQGVALRVAGFPIVRALSDRFRFLKPLDINAQDITEVVNIKSDGLATGVIGELITADGGFNYFVRSAIQWDSDAALQIKFLSSGIVIESNGSTDDIRIDALGINSDVAITGTGTISLSGSTITSVAATSQAILQGSAAQLICAGTFNFAGADIDVNNNFIRFDGMAVPATTTGEPKLFADSTNSDHLSIKSGDGSVIDLEVGGAGGATIELDNLGTTAINSNLNLNNTIDIIPSTDLGSSLGSATKSFSLGHFHEIRFDEITKKIVSVGTLDMLYQVPAGGDMVFAENGTAWFTLNGTNNNILFNRPIDMGNNSISLIDDIEINGDLNHDGLLVGFYATTPIARQLVTALTGSETLAQVISKVNIIIASLGTSGIGIFRHV